MHAAVYSKVICWVVAFSRVTNWWRRWCPNDVIRFLPVSIQSLICFYEKAWIIWVIRAIKNTNFTVNKSMSVIQIRSITESAVLISLFSLILLTQQTTPKYTDLVITDWYKTSPHFPAQCALIYLSPSFIQPLCSSLFTFHFGLLLMWTPRYQYSYTKSTVCPRIWHYKSRDDKLQIVFVLSCKILYLCYEGGHF